MKYSFKGSMVIAEAETSADNIALLSITAGTVQKLEEKVKKTYTNKPKNMRIPRAHGVYLTCDICHNQFKGKKALAFHKSRSHGILSPQYAYQKAWRLRRAEKMEKIALEKLPEEPGRIVAFKRPFETKHNG